MSKKDYYIIEKNISRILRGEETNFLDQGTYKKVISKLKNTKYQTYYPYPESEKVIIYTKKMPNIKLLEIISYNPLTHREIMGSLFGLNIDSELFGDIIITNNHYYIMIIESIYDLLLNEYKMIGRNPIELKEVPLDTLNDYQRKYEAIELITSSLRIDNVISKLIGKSREEIRMKFLNDEIIINYEVCHRINYTLKENDIFSIRKYGKYKYIGIINKTKKDNYIISINKYIDN